MLLSLLYSLLLHFVQTFEDSPESSISSGKPTMEFVAHFTQFLSATIRCSDRRRNRIFFAGVQGEDVPVTLRGMTDKDTGRNVFTIPLEFSSGNLRVLYDHPPACP
jgi:hypothetical protein